VAGLVQRLVRQFILEFLLFFAAPWSAWLA